jgi:hypothetical protein
MGLGPFIALRADVSYEDGAGVEQVKTPALQSSEARHHYASDATNSVVRTESEVGNVGRRRVTDSDDRVV